MNSAKHRRLATAEEIAEILHGKEVKRFPPQPVDKPTGTFQHFATEADRLAHLQYIEDHKAELLF